MASVRISETARHRKLSPGALLAGGLRLARNKPLGAVSLVSLLLIVLVALFATQVAPYGATEVTPDPVAKPGLPYLFGTDNLGRDILSRVIFGARVSLLVGIAATAMGVGLGSLIGVVSGYQGGAFDLIVQRIIDGMMAFPSIILAMALVSLLGTSVLWVIVAIGVIILPGATRVVRGTVLSLKENQYIEAAHAIGTTYLRLMFLHILPNVMAPIIVVTSVRLGTTILTEASLSFLGLGIQPPTPSWGAMISGSSRDWMMEAPWMAFFPGLALTITVLTFNLLGDTLRDVWDPRLRGLTR